MKHQDSIYQESLNQICHELNEYLMKRFKYKSPPTYITYTGTTIINWSRVKFSIYLRFFYERIYNLWPPKTIIIAQLGFRETRKGNGTHFLSFLKDIALRYGYEYIGLENTNDNSCAFAEHFNFQDIQEKKYYLIDVKKLQIP